MLRNEDLDHARCKPEFVAAMYEDLKWFGFEWKEGPDIGGPFAPYEHSKRHEQYLAAFEKLKAGGFVYPCVCSRQDVLRSLSAPHVGEDEPVYPGTCRPENGGAKATNASVGVSWRFKVNDGEEVSFADGFFGTQTFVAGTDFGDFVVWRHDNIPSYQLAVVADDAAMGITEVVRGEDLLRSTARQILLYRAFGFAVPEFYHCPLMTDEAGVRLAKRHDSLSLRTLREKGIAPETLRKDWS